MNPLFFFPAALAFFLTFSPNIVSADDSDLAIFFSEDAMVETTSRHPKPIIDVAENLSIVTSRQIREMNAHTLYEVLNRVPGLFLAFDGGEFGSHASVSIHGALFEDQHRLLVLLDGVRLNSVGNGIALLNGFPVGIIDRLEIIKGPASATWGSAIGGVINIITKKPADNKKATGRLAASYGNADSRDLRAEVEGAAAGQKYYFYASNQHSDGLEDDRYFDNSQVFGKGVFTISSDSTLTLSASGNNPDWKYGEFSQADQRITGETENGFVAANFSYKLSNVTSFHLEGSLTSLDHTNESEVIGTGVLGVAGDPFLSQNWEEQQVAIGGRIAHTTSNHVVVVGGEFWHEQLDYSLDAGQTAASLYGLPDHYQADRAKANNFAVFANDTLHIADLALIPGIRYDYNSNSGDFLNPSIGATYPVSPDTRLRATFARGFSSPYLALTEEVTPFSITNPDLNAEEIWSFQAGLETKAIPMLLIKGTTFYHDISEVWSFDSQGMIVNEGSSKRSGLEVELETVSWHKLTFAAAVAYTHDNPDDGESDDYTKGTVKVAYNNPALFDVDLFGSYVHWLDAITYEAEGDNFIWDLNIRKSFSTGERTFVDLFMTLHNLTDADQYAHAFYPNPGRWLEVGLRYNF